MASVVIKWKRVGFPSVTHLSLQANVSHLIELKRQIQPERSALMTPRNEHHSDSTAWSPFLKLMCQLKPDKDFIVSLGVLVHSIALWHGFSLWVVSNLLSQPGPPVCWCSPAWTVIHVGPLNPDWQMDGRRDVLPYYFPARHLIKIPVPIYNHVE